jgi:hypothetical protein
MASRVARRKEPDSTQNYGDWPDVNRSPFPSVGCTPQMRRTGEESFNDNCESGLDEPGLREAQGLSKVPFDARFTNRARDNNGKKDKDEKKDNKSRD